MGHQDLWSRAGSLLGLVVAVGLGLSLLSGCGSSDPAPSAEPAASPQLEMEHLWSRSTDMWGPGAISGRWWLTSTDRQGGPGPSFGPQAGSLQLGNALTGKVQQLPNPGGNLVCYLRGLPEDSDADRGRFLVETGPASGSGACESAVLEVTSDHHRWTRPGPEATRSPAPDTSMGETVMGTWDDTTIISTGDTVRGEDADGATAWTAPLAHRDSGIWFFDWTERVVATDWGPLLVEYDFRGPGPVTDLGFQPDARLSLLDPATGEARAEVGTVEGSDFLWMVGDVAIFARGGDYSSTYEGYLLRNDS